MLNSAVLLIIFMIKYLTDAEQWKDEKQITRYHHIKPQGRLH